MIRSGKLHQDPHLTRGIRGCCSSTSPARVACMADLVIHCQWVEAGEAVIGDAERAFLS